MYFLKTVERSREVAASVEGNRHGSSEQAARNSRAITMDHQSRRHGTSEQSPWIIRASGMEYQRNPSRCRMRRIINLVVDHSAWLIHCESGPCTARHPARFKPVSHHLMSPCGLGRPSKGKKAARGQAKPKAAPKPKAQPKSKKIVISLLDDEIEAEAAKKTN